MFLGIKELNVWWSSSENKELSNLASRPFVDKAGKPYVSVEHAYQTYKSGKFDEVTYNKPWKAGMKIFGRYKANREKNVEIMYNIIKASFEQNPKAMELLENTGTAKLTHLQDKGIWKEMFPELLMRIRAGN